MSICVFVYCISSSLNSVRREINELFCSKSSLDESVLAQMICSLTIRSWILLQALILGIRRMESTKLLYIAVLHENEEGMENASFQYTRSMLQSTLQFMGCKARHAFKVYIYICGQVSSLFSLPRMFCLFLRRIVLVLANPKNI